ncbi:MAG TPA: hypothetical protein VEQ42_05165 [Pyrinomonadaceae bacterium]|nr:hypothetical protein [Pyrinomonadaceae bacterium]
MSTNGKEALVALALMVAVVLGCNSSGGNNSNSTTTPNGNAANATAKTAPPTTKSSADGVIASGTGTEKEKPEAGKANVQGKVFFNEKPAEGVEVKLCEKFNQFFGGCGGETYTTKTDAGGEYLIKNVPPKTYEGLIVKVFNSNYYVFATSGIVQSAKYEIEADKTFFAPDTNLFKNDLKLQSPKAGSKLAADAIEVKWDSYPDAAYYKMSIYADTNSGAKPEYDFIGRRVDGQSFTLDKPLTPGAYTCRVEAYNGNDIKLAQSTGDIKFTVTGGAAK